MPKSIKIDVTDTAKRALEWEATIQRAPQSKIVSDYILHGVSDKALELAGIKRPERTEYMYHERKLEVSPLEHRDRISEAQLLATIYPDVPLEHDPASQELIRRYSNKKMGSREMASKIGRCKSTINAWRAKQKGGI